MTDLSFVSYLVSRHSILPAGLEQGFDDVDAQRLRWSWFLITNAPAGHDSVRLNEEAVHALQEYRAPYTRCRTGDQMREQVLDALGAWADTDVLRGFAPRSARPVRADPALGEKAALRVALAALDSWEPPRADPEDERDR